MCLIDKYNINKIVEYVENVLNSVANMGDKHTKQCLSRIQSPQHKPQPP